MKFHWIMTVLLRGSFAQLSGNYESQPGDTRAAVFDHLHKLVASKVGADSPPVVFFALEPNELGGTR